MIETLQGWDEALLLKLHLAGEEPWDTLMYYATKTWVWIPLFSWWGYLLYQRYKRDFIRWVVFTLLVVGLTDTLCGQGLKPWIGRRRPSHEAALKVSLRLVRGYTGGLYGFPSNHAANSAALAFAIGLALRRVLITFIVISWAVLHSYTRIYLGVHYPGDILAGWGIGLLISSFLYLIVKKKNIL